MPRVAEVSRRESLDLPDTFRAPQLDPLRDRLIAAAVHLTTARGWGAVTMARLAELAGVSRQTVYNEIGGKSDLADAMVQSELGRFLQGVTAAFDAHPDDVVAAVEQAVLTTLTSAATNPLLQAIVSATHGLDTELLPLVTTRAATLLGTASAVVGDLVGRYDLPISPALHMAAVDVVVRVVLSHVMQPGAAPAVTAHAVALAASALLDP